MVHDDFISPYGFLTWSAAIVFAAVWLHNAVQVWIGGDELNRIVAGFRGNVFDGYRQSVAHRLEAFARWVRDTHAAGVHAFSGSAFLLCLGAAIYPIVAFVVAWAIGGGSGRFGDLQVLPGDIAQSERMLLFAALAAPAAVAGGLRVLAMADFLLFVGSLIAFVAAGALAYAGASPVAVLAAASFAVAALFAGAAAIAGVFTAVFATAFAAGIAGGLATEATAAFAVAAGAVAAVGVAGVVDLADRRGFGWIVVPFLVAAYLAAALALARAGGSGFVAPLDATRDGFVGAAVAVLFLAVFPAVNAPITWLSIGVTRALTSWFVNAAQGMAAAGVGLAALVIAVDAAIALALSAATVAGLAAAATLVSQAHVAAGGAPLFDVAAVVSQMRADPGHPDWWWVYAMIFATLIPTFIHFLAFARALATIVLIKPLTGTAWIADGLDRGHAHKGVFVIVPSFVLTALQLVPAIGVLVLAAVFLPAISAVETAIAGRGEWLGDIAIRAARSVT